MTENAGETGLLEAHRRVANGEGHYYGLFYSKDAAFWRTLDELIGAATDNT